jgi:hypothetical protein
MAKRIKRDPEREARWAEARRRVQERIEHNERLIREAQEREERRRRRLRRLTFGLLPR